MTATRTDTPRTASYGSTRQPTPVDRFGVWLSGRSIRRGVGSFEAKRLGDFGCGYNATFVRSVLPVIASASLVDVTLAEDLKAHPKVRAVEGVLPAALQGFADETLDVILCISSLEHLNEPEAALAECHRLLAPGGVLLVNVPTWLGKRFLEFSAFRLGLSPAEEMDDHEMYYDPKDLWPLLRRAGFLPHNIRCFRHKAGLNTFAICRTEDAR
ncbi:MAG: methyltransferase domain-containing protein [Acidimicrobiaceae bacterium]|nr:methyltransferase domain-containing protein [Acidimicrobiaceae bacterium]